MMIATLMESAQETRVAITPNSAKQYIKLGYDVGIEKNAGLSSDFTNEEFEKAGATIFDSKSTLLKKLKFFYVLMNLILKT